MVSQMSSRLLSGHHAVSSSCSASSERSNAASSTSPLDEGQSSVATGYSADRESRNGSPPGDIDLHIKHRRTTLSDPDERAKRRKVNEMQFQATTAKADITRAGMSIPVIQSGRSRAIPLGKVDMTKVQLISSKSVASSPFLTPEVLGWPSAAATHDFVTYFGRAYGDLIATCSFAYNPPSSPPPRVDTDTESTISSSSVSDNESDDSRGSSPVLAINARLDDAITESESSDGMTLSSNDMISCPLSLAITMEKALTVCQKSRLITLASPPFTVIHSNAAFAQLTGLPSNKILGHGFFTLLAGESSEKLSLPSCAVSSSSGQDLVIDILNETKGESPGSNPTFESVTCRMKVTPIMSGQSQGRPDCASSGVGHREAHSDIREVSNVTHFAIDLMSATDGISPERKIRPDTKEDTPAMVVA